MTGTSLPQSQPAPRLADKYPPGADVASMDGADFRQLFEAAYAWLAQHHESVNALNVFPVPDGDTGTNMLLTMQSTWEEIVKVDGGHLGKIMQAASHGALMGARGNSGVILSQILRGMARGLEQNTTCNANQLAHALRLASDTAYKGVVKPVEGTILTVIRLVADAAEKAAQLDHDLRFVFRRITHTAAEAVAKTPSLLAVLAQAGVVDAGGKGLFYLLEGMTRALEGERVTQDSSRQVAFAGQADALEGEYGFDIQFILQGSNLDVDEIRRVITGMGESVLVVGDRTAVKVHLHAGEPGAALNYGVSVGHMSRIIVENMDAQFQEFVHGEGSGDGPLAGRNPAHTDAQPLPAASIATIVVAPGVGLQQVFQSLGASQVVAGGQTMNPSTQELLAAVEASAAEDVIILPNNSNIVMAAQQASSLAHKRVHVVPSKTIPQGISALIAFQPADSVANNLAAMTRALAAIDTGEITVAVRSATFDDIRVAAGEVIGLLNDVLTAHGHQVQEVALELLRQMQAETREIITIYHGQPVTAAEATALQAVLRVTYPDQTIELVNGGQPHYHYILSAE
ncbi:DAK2 domain-containing protein [Candidatus Amarolinea dominans]|uniref:DAK2 domain-containing protein n=1 Tax=Candidatus Amarolinea dominans TaxID=3140696 RepID=UPI001D469B1D|nr:DAK2 domain-containing protein [Anaerolineae bacterium]MBK7201537.1 DAK2 domain-containing protein [Anaerolineae bacterium]MBK9231528.1 DAK2 domain-containing protein [Anaerolineae bacterium]